MGYIHHVENFHFWSSGLGDMELNNLDQGDMELNNLGQGAMA